MAKRFLYFIIICLWFMGGVGSIGYALYEGSWPIAVGAAINAVLAFPKVKGFFDALMV